LQRHYVILSEAKNLKSLQKNPWVCKL